MSSSSNETAGSLGHLYGGLNEFSALLTKALGSLDNNVNTLSSANNATTEQLEALRSVVDKYGLKLQNLELEAAAQRDKLELALRNVSDMEKSIDTQLSDATKQMHRELLTQKTSTKMDLFALSGSLRKQMNDAMELIQESPKLLRNSIAVYNPNASVQENVQVLIDKIKVLEDAMMIQHNVNVQLSDTMKNDDIIRKVYDQLFDQISKLEDSLNMANHTNQELREKYSTDLQTMRNLQESHQQQINQLVSALLTNKGMKKFRNTMAKISEYPTEEGGTLSKRHTHHLGNRSQNRERTATSTGGTTSNEVASIPEGEEDEAADEEAIPMSRVSRQSKGEKKKRGEEETKDSAEMGDERDIEGEAEAEDKDKDEGERPSKRSMRRKTRHRRHRRHSDSDEDSDEDGVLDDDEEAEEEDDYDEEEERRRRRRRRHRSTRHGQRRRPTEEHGGPAKDDVAAPTGILTPSLQPLVPPPVNTAMMPQLEEKPTAAKGAPTPVRREKTFNSTPKAEEKHTQTAKPEAASVSTNTDKSSAVSASTNTDKIVSSAVSTNTDRPGAVPPPAKTTVVTGSSGSAPLSPSTGEAKGTVTFDDESSSPMRDEDGYDSLDSQSYYSQDSYYGVSPEQLEQVAAESRNQLAGLRTELLKKTEELEDSMNTFKRIAFMVDDMKINYELLKQKLDGFGGHHTHGGAVSGAANFDEMKTNAQYHSIQQAKILWTKVHAELVEALERYNEAPNNDDEGYGDFDLHNEKPLNEEFISKASKLITYLDNNLASFHPAETVAATLKIVHPMLESLYKQALDLDQLDAQIRSSPESSLGCHFDLLLCSDGTHDLKQYVRDAMNASVPVLDELIPKVAMRQRIENIERALQLKADKSAFKALQDEFKNLVKSTVDVKDFQATISKLATTAELQKVNLYVSELGSRGSGVGYSNMRSDTGTIDIETVELQKNPDFQSLLMRFDMLGKQQLDLHNFCTSFVPREEVHEAMKAVIAEVKALKKSSVNHALFRDGLKAKADVAEVERVVKAITDAVGEINLSKEDSAAAIHAKCLMCDKPLTMSTQRARTAAVGRNRSSGLVSSSMPLIGYSKAMDDNSVNSNNDAHEAAMFNRLTSSNPAVSNSERVKVATELAILRSTIDPLPDINDPSSSVGEGQPQVQHNATYKQRIRHSAGGGVGPTYKKDTR